MFHHAIALCFDFANDEETLVMTQENLPNICAAVKRRLDDILASTNLEAFADINDTYEE